MLTKDHYALQLSELLQISQQAVVKHTWHPHGFVSVDKVPSRRGAAKKVYR